MKTIYYWPCGTGYWATLEGEPHFALDSQDFINRIGVAQPKELYKLKLTEPRWNELQLTYPQ